MRVLHVYSGNLYGGIEAILTTIARHPDSSSGLISEFALCFQGRLQEQLTGAGATVHPLGEVRVSRPHSVRRARRALAALIASKRFDCVLCHAAWAHALFAPVVRRAGATLVFWAHDIMRGQHWTERWAKRTPPALVIANSRFTAASVPAVFPTAPVSVVYAPVALPVPGSNVVHRDAIRAELTTPRDARVIVLASRMEAWKGHDVLLDALSQLPEGREWVCWIVGGAQRPAEAAFAASLRDRARSLGLDDRVRFVGERTDIPRLLAAADIHCQPNLEPEPFGIVFVEALAAGLPVVTSCIGGAVEIVDLSCGVFVPPGDSAAVAAALHNLIDDARMRTWMSAAAPLRAQAVCDPARQIHALHAALATHGVAVPSRI